MGLHKCEKHASSSELAGPPVLATPHACLPTPQVAAINMHTTGRQNSPHLSLMHQTQLLSISNVPTLHMHIELPVPHMPLPLLLRLPACCLQQLTKISTLPRPTPRSPARACSSACAARAVPPRSSSAHPQSPAQQRCTPGTGQRISTAPAKPPLSLPPWAHTPLRHSPLTCAMSVMFQGLTSTAPAPSDWAAPAHTIDR